MPFVDAVPRRRMPAAKRRELILAAAEDVFARSGYHGASLDEIAGAGGISKALIYEHFDSKRELRACLLEAHTAELFGRLQASAEAGATGEERLRGGIEAFLGFVEERRAAWRALFRDAADPEVAERIQGVRAQAAALIAELIATDPETPDSGAAGSDPRRRQYIETLAQLLSGGLQSLANWWHDHPDVPRRAVVDHATAFAWLGLERLRDSARETRD